MGCANLWFGNFFGGVGASLAPPWIRHCINYKEQTYTRLLRFLCWIHTISTYRPGTVNSKSFVGQVLLRIKWKFELTVHFKHEMIRKLFIKTSQKLWIKWNFELTVFELTVPDLYLSIPWREKEPSEAQGSEICVLRWVHTKSERFEKRSANLFEYFCNAIVDGIQRLNQWCVKLDYNLGHAF